MRPTSRTRQPSYPFLSSLLNEGMPQGRTSSFDDVSPQKAAHNVTVAKSDIQECLVRIRPVAAVVNHLTTNGYRVWRVLEPERKRADRAGPVLGALGESSPARHTVNHVRDAPEAQPQT